MKFTVSVMSTDGRPLAKPTSETRIAMVVELVNQLLLQNSRAAFSIRIDIAASPIAVDVGQLHKSTSHM